MFMESLNKERIKDNMLGILGIQIARVKCYADQSSRQTTVPLRPPGRGTDEEIYFLPAYMSQQED